MGIAYNNQVISLLTDVNGQILRNNSNLDFSKNIHDLINLPTNDRVLFVNYFEKNYIVSKVRTKISESIYYQFILHEWRLISHIAFNDSSFKQIVLNYNDLTDSEKIIIYSLLNGYKTDKEIAKYLELSLKFKINGNIKYIMSKLLDMFHVFNRDLLFRSLVMNNLDSYLPEILFPKGTYQLN